MFELIQLKQLVGISKNGTFTLASEELAISQSALTRSIQRLEYELGAELFDRKKNKTVLNNAGKEAVKQAEKILSLCDELAERVKKLSHESRAVFLGTVAPAPIWILQERKEFFPQKIEWEIADEKSLLKGAESGKYDFVILQRKPLETENFSFKKICEENLFFSLPQNHKFAKRKRLSFSEMDGENFVVFAKIGFWEKIHRENLPHSKFIFQDDKDLLETLTQNTALPHFVTDLSLKHLRRPVKNKAIVPIADKAAHAQFFLWQKK